jgi:heat shock protein HslJ
MKKLLFLSLFLYAFLFIASCEKPVGGVIDNTHWTLTAAKQGNKVIAPRPGSVITAHFANGKLTGDGTCNLYFTTFTTNGVQLSLGDIASTERMCDEIDQENGYLGMLAKAKNYSASDTRLDIFCENGKLTFARMSEEEVHNANNSKVKEQLQALFPQMEGDVMPHLYPILKVDNPGDYPYVGTLVDTSYYHFFDEESTGIWSNAGGEVFAVGKFRDLYICRVPGRYVSSDIALFQMKNGVLSHSETVAWAWCDEGWCNQQDAWLTDIDKDGRTDIVQHYIFTDNQKKVREERLTVLLQEEGGRFEENTDLRLNRTQFEMAKL